MTNNLQFFFSVTVERFISLFASFFEDMNECLLGIHQCGNQSTCENTNGSFVCKCSDGFERDGLPPECESKNNARFQPLKIKRAKGFQFESSRVNLEITPNVSGLFHVHLDYSTPDPTPGEYLGHFTANETAYSHWKYRSGIGQLLYKCQHEARHHVFNICKLLLDQKKNLKLLPFCRLTLLFSCTVHLLPLLAYSTC